MREIPKSVQTAVKSGKSVVLTKSGKMFRAFKTQKYNSTMCFKATDIQSDANTEMYGADSAYLEYAGLANQIGNK